MNRARKLLGRGAFTLAGLALLIWVTLQLVGNRIHPQLLEFVARNGAGLELSARGPVTLRFWPSLRIGASELSIAPAVAAAAGWSAQLQHIDLEIAAWSALRGQFVPERVEIRGLRVRIEDGSDGEFRLPGALVELAKSRVRIDDANIELVGDGTAQSHAVLIQHATSGPGPDGFPHLEVRGLVDGEPMSVDARFATATGQAGKTRGFPLTASVSVPAWNLRGTVGGHVTLPLEGKGLALQTTLEIGDVGPLLQALDLPGPLRGQLKLQAALDGDLPSPRLTRIEATLNDGKALSASVEGTNLAIASGEVELLNVSLNTPLYKDGADKRSGAVRQMNVEASLQGARGRYRLDLKRLRVATSAKAWIEAKGQLELAALDEWTAARGKLELSARTPSVDALSRLIGGGEQSDFGPVVLSGQLSGALTAATLASTQLQIGAGGPVQLFAKGQVGPIDLSGAGAPMAVSEIDAQVEMTRDESAMRAYVGDALATLAPWVGHARLRLSPTHWSLNDLTVKSGGDTGARVELSGRAGGRGALADGVGRILSGTLQKEDSADLDVVLESVNAQATAQLLGINVPELGALQGRSHLQTEGSGLALRGLELRSAGAFALELTGDIGAINGLRDMDLKLTLAPTRPEAIDRLFDLQLPLAKAVSLAATLHRPGEQVLSVNGEVQVGSSRLSLELTAEETETVPLVKGRIHSTKILAADFWGRDAPVTGGSPAVPSAPAAPATPVRSASAQPDGLGLLGILPGLDFVLQDTLEQEQEQIQEQQQKQQAAVLATSGAAVTDTALPWSRLRHVDIALDVHVDTVQGAHIDGGPLVLRLVDQGGRLQFGPSKLTFKGGSVTLGGVADANAEPPSVVAYGRGEDLPVEELAAQRGVTSSEMVGQLSFDYDLRARGDTLIELRNSLNGEIKALVEDGQFPLGNFDLLSGNVLNWLTTWMNKDKQTPVPCAIAHFTVNDGIAEAQTLYLQTDRSAAFGIGILDLRSDQMDLTITPKVKGISLSPPPTIRLHGALAAPDLEVANASSVLLHYGSEVAASMSFSPAVLFGSLFGNTADTQPSPCR